MKRKWKIVLVVSLIGNLCIFYVAYKALEYRAHINHFLEKYTHVTAEFSGRSVFEQDNQRIKSRPPTDDRIVFFGTQVIAKWDLEASFPQFDAINRGIIDGQRVSGFLLRFKPDVIDLQPRAVLIEVSSYNLRPQNTIQEIEDYVSLMAQLSRANGIEPVLTTMIPPAVDVRVEDSEAYSVHDSLTIFNEWMMDYCAANKYALVDFYGLLSDSSGYLTASLSSNDMEPNEAGYRKLTDETAAVLEAFHRRGLTDDQR